MEPPSRRRLEFQVKNQRSFFGAETAPLHAHTHTHANANAHTLARACARSRASRKSIIFGGGLVVRFVLETCETRRMQNLSFLGDPIEILGDEKKGKLFVDFPSPKGN